MDTHPNNTHNIRALVRGRDDIQRLRIQAGNRIIANAYVRMGVDPGEKIDPEDKQAKSILERIEVEFKMLSEGLTRASNQARIKRLMKDRTRYELIQEDIDVRLVSNWTALHKVELDALKDIEAELGKFEIWTEYLKQVKGIGPSIGGYLVSGLDIRKARYVSSLWKYCGLDVVNPNQEQTEPEYRLILEDKWPVRGGKKTNLLWTKKGEDPLELECVNRTQKDSIEMILENQKHFEMINVGDKVKPVGSRYEMLVVQKTDERKHTGLRGEGRSRRKSHLETRPFTDKEGNTELKLGLSYNPRMKTVVAGILPDCLMRGNTHYKGIYDDYRQRLLNQPKRYPGGDMTQPILLRKAHMHAMGKRYIAKVFLQNFFIAWRTIEQLPIIRGPYATEKLGMSAHPDPWFDPTQWDDMYVGPGPDEVRGKVPATN